MNIAEVAIFYGLAVLGATWLLRGLLSLGSEWWRWRRLDPRIRERLRR